NPEDGWAWRELAFCQMFEYDLAGNAKRLRFETRIVAALAECARTAPEGAATTRVQAQWHEARGEWKPAVDLWLKSIDQEPSNFYSYRHIWDCSSSFPAEQRKAVWEKIEPILLRHPGHLSIARDTLALLAQRFGP